MEVVGYGKSDGSKYQRETRNSEGHVHTVKLIENYGLENDAHAGNWHRQVSLLSYEKIEEFKAKGAPVQDGAFGIKNLIVQGF